MIKKLKLSVLTLTFAVSGTCLFGCAQTKGFTLNENSVSMSQYDERKLDISLSGISLDDIVFSSSNYAVASVDDGLITSKLPGKTTINAEYAKVSYSCSLLVTATKTGRSLSSSDESLTMNIGDTHQLTFVLKESGEVKEANIVYETSLPEAISVSSSGLVTAQKRGSGIVSAYCVYKGQKLTKDVPVAVQNITSASTSLSFVDKNQTSSSLKDYSGDKAALGFEAADNVMEYQSAGGFESRIFSDEAFKDGRAANDRLVFRIRFNEDPSEGTSFYLSAKKKFKGNELLQTTSTSFLFYDYKGRIADYVRLSKVYYVMINLNRLSPDELTLPGFAFNGPTKAYISSPVLASEDYCSTVFSFVAPNELPDLNYVYAETGAGLDAGVKDIDAFDKYWIGYSSGTKADWDDSIWTSRVSIGGVDYATYRQYAFMEMDLCFTNVDFRNILIWTGGYYLKSSPTMEITSSEGTPQSGDLLVYQGETEIKAGTHFEANKVYTFKIRIQKDNLENIAFGLTVNSASKDAIYFANPNFTLF